jgi:hypothetical protein
MSAVKVAAPESRGKRHDIEGPIQRAILETLWTAYPDVLVASIPNGGFVLDARTVARLKWQGLLPGMPDLSVYWTGGCGLIEVKSEAGKLSPDQIHVHALLRLKGHRVAVCRSVRDLIDTMTEWGVPGRIASAA